ncbi:hypothetical protein [Helicobacter turcicus]|uniref:Uncharacterized protein n=1 Tax=Helicobacter turcicus TaxID=2867412 RepID=A0ABS7JPD5_9HELI|nr:hypothetical protein [Helicobacter turcicus]MBX7491275.1 hypothetical protein [Helicobacter turcicus]MBX7546086.1 hypothetical protein [Helicobacter turcicus]
MQSTLEEFKERFNISFNNELAIRCQWQNNGKDKQELEILNYLKEQLGLVEHFFKDENYVNENLYDLALEVEKYNQNPNAHNPFGDFPLCDLLNGIYLDYSALCSLYAEDLIDKSQIDLSNLESLKEALAQNLITNILKDYKSDVDYLLNENYSDYAKISFLIELLEEQKESLPIDLELSYSLDSNNIIDLNTLTLSPYSKEQLKCYLLENPDYESDYTSIDAFLKLDALKNAIAQNAKSQESTLNDQAKDSICQTDLISCHSEALAEESQQSHRKHRR